MTNSVEWNRVKGMDKAREGRTAWDLLTKIMSEEQQKHFSLLKPPVSGKLAYNGNRVTSYFCIKTVKF